MWAFVPIPSPSSFMLFPPSLLFLPPPYVVFFLFTQLWFRLTLSHCQYSPFFIFEVSSRTLFLFSFSPPWHHYPFWLSPRNVVSAKFVSSGVFSPLVALGPWASACSGPDPNSQQLTFILSVHLDGGYDVSMDLCLGTLITALRFCACLQQCLCRRVRH
ncbi:hypothetical protein M427DRAFT_287697 [Gonapodya prolifera JEL478]|uniref:Uncharacterized protein n=1 Tax=Gonapodya prolifera (strain JEL478) TaxID=1344416 RepID=A0A139AJI5_GONPJ|nr:hypothetical protein M427DRAFT_287697 [Gonapodya prolifera JEL478]|eukprot:KXS16565.1 hypothetical protein M427DRAFT_287697 [Gonapodya prolifera JEL478]